MQNLFIQENEEFTIGFTVATDKKGTIFCDLNRESLNESIQGSEDMEVQDYKAVFKRPSFGTSLELYDSIFSVNETRGVSFNPILASFNKIVALIKSWNLKGEDEKPTEEDIRSLHPVIAQAITIQLDAETGSIFG
jgi:hypothetical protein